MDDSGGGQRPAMLARAFLALGWRVSYAHRYPKAEEGDAGLLAAHPWLDESSWANLAPQALAPEAAPPLPAGEGGMLGDRQAARASLVALGQGEGPLAQGWRQADWAEALAPGAGLMGPAMPVEALALAHDGALAEGFKPAWWPDGPPPQGLSAPGAGPLRWVLVAFPHPDALPWVAEFQALGYRVCLDLIDAWGEAGLAAHWFDAKALGRLARGADALVASAKPLVAQLASLVPGAEVAYVPNAVRAELFDPAKAWPRPADLPVGGPVLLYVGALWGGWVDQKLLRALAKAWPEAQVILVGDGPPPEAPEPRNLLRLGLKAQDELPAYLAHAEVGLIPFSVDALTAAVSPLKAFEYLAMGLPVVSTWLPELEGMQGVRLAQGVKGFEAACRASVGQRLSLEACAAFRRDHGWLARAEAMAAHWAQLGERARPFGLGEPSR